MKRTWTKKELDKLPDVRKWTKLNNLAPKHKIVFLGTPDNCTDWEPNGWGNFGCKRCNLIHEFGLGYEKKQ